jgi:hypothetical protein
MSSVKKYIYSALTIFLTLPQLAGAQNIWEGTKCAPTGEGPTQPCGFCDMIVVGVNVIDIMMEAAALIVLIMLIWGGFLMMTSAGSQSKYEEGKKKITSAIIGLVVTLAAWAIVNTLFMAIAAISGASEITWNNIKCN